MKKNRTMVKDDWQPSAKTVEWFRENYSYIDLPEFVENFIDQCMANGYKYVDHDRALKAWMRRQKPPSRVHGQKLYKAEPKISVNRESASNAIMSMKGVLGRRCSR